MYKIYTGGEIFKKFELKGKEKRSLISSGKIEKNSIIIMKVKTNEFISFKCSNLNGENSDCFDCSNRKICSYANEILGGVNNGKNNK